MTKNIKTYISQIQVTKKNGGVGSKSVNLSYSKDDPLIKTRKKINELLKKL